MFIGFASHTYFNFKYWHGSGQKGKIQVIIMQNYGNEFKRVNNPTIEDWNLLFHN